MWPMGLLFYDIKHFHHNLTWPQPSTTTLSQGVMNFTVLVNPSLFIIITVYILSLSDLCSAVEKKINILRNNAFLLYDLYGHSLAQEPLPWGSWNVGRTSLSLHFFILNLPNLCSEVEKKTLKEIMHFHYVTTWQHTSIRTSAPGVMKFTTLVDYSVIIIPIYSAVLSMPRSRKKTFKDIHKFNTFYPQIISPWSEGHEIYNFLSPYTTDATYQIWFRMAQ